MSDFPEIPTLAELPRALAAWRGDAPALVQAGRTTSFRELDARSNRVANALLAQGVRRGARVALLDKDSERSFELVFGCAKAGAVSLGLNWRLTAPELAFMLADAEVELLFAGAEFAAKVEALRAECPALRRVIALSGTQPAWGAFAAWRDATEARDPRIEVAPHEVAVQMYTSGTTGRPKGVMLPQRSFSAIVRALRAAGDAWIGWSERDVALHNIPLFHIGGLWWAVTALAHGARLALLDAFAARAALELIARERVTKLCAVPAMLQMLLAEPLAARTDYRALTHIVYGGSPIPLALLERARATFGCRFAQIYGLTETGNTAVCLRPEDHERGGELLKAAGRPYPGVRIEVVDGAGRALPPRAIGEIRIDSPANMLGYWKRPEASAQTLVDGWVHTGDAGYLDEQGYVYVCDRVKDMIISAGENLYPAEIENALASHPAVAEVAVIGVPDELWGEQVKAIVVLRAGHSASAAQLVAHARPQLAEFKLPRSVDFVEQLPRTPSGKLKKNELRAPYWKGRERQVN